MSQARLPDVQALRDVPHEINICREKGVLSSVSCWGISQHQGPANNPNFTMNQEENNGCARCRWASHGCSQACVYLRVSQNYGYLFGGPNNKDYNILGSILGSPYFGKLPLGHWLREKIGTGCYGLALSVEGPWFERHTSQLYVRGDIC